MKKLSAYGLIFLVMFAAGNTFASTKAVQTRSIMPTQGPTTPLSTTPSAAILNIEAPFRCSVKEFGDVDVMTTIALREQDFKMSVVNEGGKLPRYEVNGFSFTSMPVDEAIQKLVDEAGISVYTEDNVYPELNANDVYGELEPVLNELTNAADIYYHYDAPRKRLYLSRRAKVELQLPDSRLVMFAMLDAIRGAGIETADPNWKKNTITMTLNHSDQEKVQELINYILRDSKLLLVDTQVYSLTPKVANANWQTVINRFGPGRVYTSNTGLMGRMITMGHKEKAESLLAALAPSYSTTLVSEGVAIVPHGWKMRFDVGRCAKTQGNLSSLSVLLSTNIKSPDSVDTAVTLDTLSGEITTFDVSTAIDNELAIIGIPAAVDKSVGGSELLVTLKLRFIRLIPEGK